MRWRDPLDDAARLPFLVPPFFQFFSPFSLRAPPPPPPPHVAVAARLRRHSPLLVSAADAVRLCHWSPLPPLRAFAASLLCRCSPLPLSQAHLCFRSTLLVSAARLRYRTRKTSLALTIVCIVALGVSPSQLGS